MSTRHPPHHGEHATADQPAVAGSTRVRIRVKRRRRWARRRALRRRLLLGTAVVLGLLLVDGVWSALQGFQGLEGARAGLQEGSQALLAGDLDRADREFRSALDGGQGAGTALVHPAVWVVDILPGVGDDVDALQALADSAQAAATAGVDLVAAAESSGWDGSSIPGIEAVKEGRDRPVHGADASEAPVPTPGQAQDRGGGGRGDRSRDGDRGQVRGGERSEVRAPGQAVEDLGAGLRVHLPILELAAPHLAAAARAITEAEGSLLDVDTDGLWYPVAAALEEAKTQIGGRAGIVRAISHLAQLLPRFLGGEEPRRYFLAFQNLSAPRGTGGFLGIYGILRAEKGRLELERMSSVRELPATQKAVEAPKEYTARYRRFGGTTEIFAANYSPDFPTSSRVLLKIYQESGLGKLDGVIAVDPVWASYALKAAGPVTTPAWPEPITAENASRILQHDVFLLGKQESDATQIALGKALIDGLLRESLDPRTMADSIARAVAERHLQVYSADPAEEGLLGRLGAAGAVRLGSDPLFVVWQDATGNKVGYFARKEVSHRVVLHSDGSAQITTRIELDNRAPPGPPSVLLGTGTEGDPPGFFAAYVNVYLPRDAERIRSHVSAFPGLGLVEREFGRPVVLEVLEVPAGRSSELEVTYRVPHAVSTVDGASEFRARFLPQPALRPGPLSVEIVLPEGAGLIGAAPGMGTGPVVRYEGAPTTPRAFWVRYA